jgi:hypothetical protein
MYITYGQTYYACSFIYICMSVVCCVTVGLHFAQKFESVCSHTLVNFVHNQLLRVSLHFYVCYEQYETATIQFPKYKRHFIKPLHYRPTVW